jgi:hypothetical protein
MPFSADLRRHLGRAPARVASSSRAARSLSRNCAALMT